MRLCMFFFFFNDTATTEIYTLSLHDALPIFPVCGMALSSLALLLLGVSAPNTILVAALGFAAGLGFGTVMPRSEEHTSELQSRPYLVCRLLLEKKKKLTTHAVKVTSCFHRCR